LVSSLRYIDTEKEDIDFRDWGFFPSHSEIPRKHDQWKDYDNITLSETSELTRHHYFLMQPFIAGFMLKDKSWRKFFSILLSSFNIYSGMAPSIVTTDENPVWITETICVIAGTLIFTSKTISVNTVEIRMLVGSSDTARYDWMFEHQQWHCLRRMSIDAHISCEN
jgi:hypothetical protein